MYSLLRGSSGLHVPSMQQCDLLLWYRGCYGSEVGGGCSKRIGQNNVGQVSTLKHAFQSMRKADLCMQDAKCL